MRLATMLTQTLLATATLAAHANAAAVFTAAADHADGRYAVGEQIRFTIRTTDAAQPATYTMLRGGKTVMRSGPLVFRDGVATVDASLDAPGTILLRVDGAAARGDVSLAHAVAGAIVDADQIKPSSPRPDDFDAFWDAKLAELHAVPINAKLERGASTTQPTTQDASVDYWHITLDNIRGTHVNGQLARPKQGDKLPALLIVQWAGVYALERPWVVDRAAEGWLTLNISPHELPIDRPASFYAEQFAGPLKDYWAIGNDDRETSYYLRMYCSCVRAIDYLASRPDWDGKTIVVMGGSQGGMQSLVTAALDARVTAALADVPAGCDMLGADVGRKAGWPQWTDFVAPGKDALRVREASRYFDVVNFAPRIHCPVLIAAGEVDQTCPPEGIIAAANQVQSPKELLLMPNAGHQDEHDSHGPYTRRCWSGWLPALRQGKPAPVAAAK